MTIEIIVTPTSRGGELTENGAMVITTESPLGKAVRGKSLGEEIAFLYNNNQWKYRLVAIEDEEIELSLLEEVNEEEELTGLELYRKSRKNGEKILLLRAWFWTDDFCYAVENFEIRVSGEVDLIGTTFKEGKVYQRNKIYSSDKEFYIYNGEFAAKIKEQYEYLPLLGIQKDTIELEDEYLNCREQVDCMVKNEIGETEFEGYFLLYCGIKKKILKQVFGIEWKTPIELNPNEKFN
jgi:hypothetical protein